MDAVDLRIRCGRAGTRMGIRHSRRAGSWDEESGGGGEAFFPRGACAGWSGVRREGRAAVRVRGARGCVGVYSNFFPRVDLGKIHNVPVLLR